MACLERVLITSFEAKPGGEFRRIESANNIVVPHIYWTYKFNSYQPGEPWRAANAYGIWKARSGLSDKTVESCMSHMIAYANWLEKNKVDWFHFPIKKYERCLYRFRGFLVEQRDSGWLSASTIRSRMSAIISFYRWVNQNEIIDVNLDLQERNAFIPVYTDEGFRRTMLVKTTELAIPNRGRPGIRLEDGVDPIDASDLSILMEFLAGGASGGNPHLYLMHLIAITTGARSETIRTLRVSSLDMARVDPVSPNIMRIPVGPPTKVKTKFNVTGDLLVPKDVWIAMKDYSVSVERLVRQGRSLGDDGGLLFITRSGVGYSKNTFTKLISEIRNQLILLGYPQFAAYKFHRLRASFGTETMRIALETLPRAEDAIRFVRDAMMHKSEATTWKYVKFVEGGKVKERISDEFFKYFSGKNYAWPY